MIDIVSWRPRVRLQIFLTKISAALLTKILTDERKTNIRSLFFISMFRSLPTNRVSSLQWRGGARAASSPASPSVRASRCTPAARTRAAPASTPARTAPCWLCCPPCTTGASPTCSSPPTATTCTPGGARSAFSGRGGVSQQIRSTWRSLIYVCLKNKPSKVLIHHLGLGLSCGGLTWVFVPPGSRDPLLGSERTWEGGVFSEEERDHKPAHLLWPGPVSSPCRSWKGSGEERRSGSWNRSSQDRYLETESRFNRIEIQETESMNQTRSLS